jgi:hypothetical protein
MQSFKRIRTLDSRGFKDARRRRPVPTAATRSWKEWFVIWRIEGAKKLELDQIQNYAYLGRPQRPRCLCLWPNQVGENMDVLPGANRELQSLFSENHNEVKDGFALVP